MPIRPDKNSSSGFHQQFSRAVIDPDSAVPSGVVGPDGNASQTRFSIYRNNVAFSLVEAMGANFPAVKRLVGESRFTVFAQAYLRTHMPKSPMLIFLGGDFPEFLRAYEPALSLPYLPDVAQLEYAWLQSYHAADTPVLDGKSLGEIPQDIVGQARFSVHPATWLQRSVWPVATLVNRNRAQQDCSDIDLSVGEDVLITRPNLDVEIRVLPPHGFEFLTALIVGSQLENSAATVMKLQSGTETAFDLAEQISGMLHCGVFSSVRT